MTDLTKTATVPAVARLVFAPAVHHLILDVAADAGAPLYAATFGGPAAEIEDDGNGTVTITRRGPMHPFDVARRSAHVTLNPTAAWDIEIQGAATHLEADLTGLHLNSLSVGGGLTDARITLPHTDRTVPIHFASGVRKTTILRPVTTRATLTGEQGFTSLSLDGRWVGTVATIDWQSTEPAAGTPGCYAVTLDAGSNHLTLG
ncbi:hypothetical protein GCM10009665_52760 [Kitasatospora nipponensis]|uniref:Uncharacterized protein n=1 Tax=Kitasatospora nipponensis TaxID=258049 RepID=A0ABN1WQS0_9ACTN